MKTLTIGFLILIMINGQLNADNHSAAKNEIMLTLDSDRSEVSVKGFIAPIGDVVYTQYNFQVDWDTLKNLQC